MDLAKKNFVGEFLVSLLVELTWELNLQHLNVIITRSLKISGDVELNPGPYQIIQSVQESFNQGNVALFWWNCR